MAKFHEIHDATQQPFKIRCVGGETATVEQNKVTWDKSGALVSAMSAATWEWELVVEPTVESVIAERGWRYDNVHGTYQVCKFTSKAKFTCDSSQKPTTAAQATAICDLLDEYR